MIYSAALEFCFVGELAFGGKVHSAWSTLRAALQEAVSSHLMPKSGSDAADADMLTPAELGERVLAGLTMAIKSDNGAPEAEQLDDLGRKIQAQLRSIKPKL